MINIEGASFEMIHLLSGRKDVKKSKTKIFFLTQKVSSDHGWKVSNMEMKAVGPEIVAPRAQPEWNVKLLDAHVLWKKGFRGQGHTIGIADTGFHYKHPALINSYRGSRKGKKEVHNFNWYDGVREPHFTTWNLCGYASKEPCDDSGHGTHVLGTAIGSTEEKKIGVAPGAKWIGCRALEGGFVRDKTIIACLQFFLAPHNENGKNPDPRKRPIAIGNSYACPPTRCPDSEVQKDAVEALYSSGVMVVVAAGNDGPRCSSISK
jgi:serine protease AprX